MRKVAINCLIIMAVIGMWLVDIGQIGLDAGFYLTNNFWTLHPGVVYHLGMYLNVACLFMIMLLTFLPGED